MRSVLNMLIPLGRQVVAVQMSARFLHLELWREVGFQGQTRSWWAVGGGGRSNDDLDRVSPLERKCLPLLLMLLFSFVLAHSFLVSRSWKRESLIDQLGCELILGLGEGRKL